MAHELTLRADGTAEMAYAAGSETPWHGLGQTLPEGAGLEAWASAAGMDWTIKRSKIRYATERDAAGEASGFLTLDDKHVLFRSDNNSPLGVVSDKYQVVQPREVLEFFRDLTEGMGFKLETAGTLFEGKKFWALARITEDFAVADAADKVGGFLLLSTSSDGTMATSARYTTVRVVCNNTLSIAQTGEATVRVSHRSEFKATDAKRALGLELAQEAFGEQMEIFRKLAATPLGAKETLRATAQLLSTKDIATLAKVELMEIVEGKTAKAISNLAFGGALGAELEGTTGTLWGWVNGVTEFVDHAAGARSASGRLDSAFFGKGEALKSKAFAMAKELAA